MPNLPAALSILATVLSIGRSARRSDPWSRRQRIVQLAREQLGRGPDRYVAAELGEPMPPGLSWCGVFALWVYHRARVAPKAVRWQLGKGFAYPAGLPQVEVPMPGDLAYFDDQQHHAIVSRVNADGTFDTIDGNSIGGVVGQATRDLETARGFFSISPWL